MIQYVWILPITPIKFCVQKSNIVNLVHAFQNVASVTIDQNTGIVKSVSMLGTDIPMEQSFYYYTSSSGNNTKFEYRASGAYIFRPEINSNLTLINPKPKVETFTGMWNVSYYNYLLCVIYYIIEFITNEC